MSEATPPFQTDTTMWQAPGTPGPYSNTVLNYRPKFCQLKLYWCLSVSGNVNTSISQAYLGLEQTPTHSYTSLAPTL